MIIEINKTQYKLLLTVSEFDKIIQKDNVSSVKLFELINKVPGVFNASYSSYDEPTIYYMVPHKADSQPLHELVMLTTKKYIESCPKT